MNSLIVSIIAVALVAACAGITALSLGKPFLNYVDKTIILEINKNYIDFGIILSSSDSLNTRIDNIEDLKIYNGELPKINNIDYRMAFTTKNERVFYSTSIDENQCLLYEQSSQKNNNLEITDITYSILLENYIEDNLKNISCYKSSITNENFLVLIYPSFIN